MEIDYLLHEIDVDVLVADVRVQYGKVSLSRSQCPTCKDDSFIIDGKSVCCGTYVGDEIPRRLIKVTDYPLARRQLLPAQKMAILTKQAHKCFYCGLPFFETWYMTKKMHYPKPLRPEFDHIVPKAFTDNQELTNFVAACHICNMVKKDRVFNDMAKVVDYVRMKREKLEFTVVSE